jgi:hypothetical protein
MLAFLQTNDDEDNGHAVGNHGHERRCHLSEAALARRECKARSVLNKFKEMETKAINGESDEGTARRRRRRRRSHCTEHLTPLTTLCSRNIMLA